MAAFTSKATGNWSSGGQTTWNEAGVPKIFDSVTIQSPHTVTVSQDAAVGNGTASAISIVSGGILSVADGITLTVYGAIDNAGEIDEGAGSVIDLLTTAPLTNIGASAFFRGMSSRQEN